MIAPASPASTISTDLGEHVTHRVSAALVVVAAAAVALALTAGTGVAPWQLVSWFGRYGGPLHASVLTWLVLAPVLLLVAAAAGRRTPWPWVSAVTIELSCLVVVAARFPRVIPDWAWPALAVTVVAGLASVVTAFSGPGTDQSA